MAVTWDNIDDLTETLERERVLVVNEFEEVRLSEAFIEHVERTSELTEIKDILDQAESVEDYVGILLVPAYLGFTGTTTFTMEGLKIKILAIHGVIFARRHRDLEEWAMRLRIRGL